MGIRKAKLEGRMLDVVTYKEFCENKSIYNNTSTAVEKDGLIYPIRNQTDDRAGMYNSGVIDFFIPPEGDNKDDFSSSHVIDMSDSKSIAELMSKQNKVKDLEREILTSPDTIFVPNIAEQDSPAMRGLKKAIISKEIDINKYQDRFGKESFANDKRILKGHDITMFMLNRFTKALDIKATLRLEDRNDSVANPMGTAIDIDLTEYDD